MDSPEAIGFLKPRFCLLLLLLFLIHSLPCAQSHSQTEFCRHLFECGNITAGFPFWGENRNKHCGHSLLKLQCDRALNMTSIKVSGVLYYVLQIDSTTNTLRLVREENSNSLSFCLGRLQNPALPTELFERLSGYVDLTVSYQCDPRFHYLENSECPWNGFGSVRHQSPEYHRSCNDVVNVTVPESFFTGEKAWSSRHLEIVLREGFEARLKIDEQACRRCSSSGGACVFHNDTQACCKDVSSSGFECHLMNSSEVDELHKLCSSQFPCANQQQNLSYPFWIKGREDCGHPDFEVDCSGEFAEINISSVKFRLLEVDYHPFILRLSRTDYVSTLCPLNPLTTTFNGNFLGYTPDTELLTLYYECPNLGSRFPSLTPYIRDFDCGGDDDEGRTYYVTRNLTSSLFANFGALFNDFAGLCKRNVTIPASGSALTMAQTNPSPENLQRAFIDGFGVKLNETNCTRCIESNGACGYNQSLGRFVCYCSDGPSELLTCGSERKKSSGLSKGAKLGIGLASGLVGGLLIAGGLFCFIYQRRKKLSAQYTSKDLPTMPNSSRGTTTPATSTTISRSMQSFQSSQSNLGNGSVYVGVQVFSYEELEEATENFSKELGDGGFGTVYYGVLRDGRLVAVKRLYERSLRRVEQFKNEIEILKSLKHPNLVILYGCTSRHSRELLLVYEYIPNGTLADHLHGDRAKTHPLSWPVRLEIAIETASALSYLHASGIIHRDVKTTNILLHNNCQVKVADFGLSRLFPMEATHVSTAPQGTPGYVDPEYFQCYRLNEKSDVYSFGVVLAELISSKEAVDITRHRHDINLANMAIARIQNAAVEELVDPDLGFDRDFAVRRMVTAVAELAFRCLQPEREMRPSMDEALEVLKAIKKEEMGEPAELVDIGGGGGDDVGLLRNCGAPPPLSPETDKWTNSSNSNTTGSSF